MNQSPVSVYNASAKHAPSTASSLNHTVHFYSDQEWMAIRHEQMNITSNCIFPARERRSMAAYLQLFRSFLVFAFRLPIRF